MTAALHVGRMLALTDSARARCPRSPKAGSASESWLRKLVRRRFDASRRVLVMNTEMFWRCGTSRLQTAIVDFTYARLLRVLGEGMSNGLARSFYRLLCILE